MHFCRITGAKYSTCHKEVTEVWESSQWPLWSGMYITPLCITSSLMKSFNKAIFLSFCNKFHILSRDGKMLGLSPGVKISISSKSGNSTFVVSTIIMMSLVAFNQSLLVYMKDLQLFQTKLHSS